MEKAIEIKRRAQRCIQNGDLDGALVEYQKLTSADDSDPYIFVLVADLFYKKGDSPAACQNYLSAIGSYEKAGLFKNAIAVCKKMMRLALSPPLVLQRLAELHALDGLATEAALYYMQYAEHQIREEKFRDAADTLRKAFETCPDNLRPLEKHAEALLLAGDEKAAADAMMDAAERYRAAGQAADAVRTRDRAEEIRPGAAAPYDQGTPRAPREERAPAPVSRAVETHFDEADDVADDPVAHSFAAPPALEIEPSVPRAGETYERAADAVEDHEPTARPTAATPPPAGDWFTTNATEVGASPIPSGLRFESEPVANGRPESGEPPLGLAAIEALLHEAEQQLEGGDRETATATLVRAAQAYESLERHESAAAIYRSLSRSAHATAEVLDRWLRNAEARGDAREAGEAACALGDRALNENDVPAARGWFERARELDPNNDLARRRLQRLDGGDPGDPSAPEAGSEIASGEVADESGRVEVAVGRAQAVTFDLGALLAEFQRGVEAQLSGDPQSHYDLAMTYREMGLLEQAIESFRLAARDPGFAPRAAEMIGRSLLDEGRFDDAVQEFESALALEGLSNDVAVDLRYQLGLAHEAAGRPQVALVEFERVYAAQASYPDVSMKIRVLRRTLESV